MFSDLVVFLMSCREDVGLVASVSALGTMY